MECQNYHNPYRSGKSAIHRVNQTLLNFYVLEFPLNFLPFLQLRSRAYLYAKKHIFSYPPLKSKKSPLKQHRFSGSCHCIFNKKMPPLARRHRRYAFSQAAKLSYTYTLRFNCNAIRHSSTNENYTVEYFPFNKFL